jgi:AhpD family alkylhydroperoxidase
MQEALMTVTQQDAARRRAAARIPLTQDGSLFTRIMTWYSRRTYGDVLDSGLAMIHNRRVLMSVVRFERAIARWNRLDPNLKTLAVMASAGTIGCSWCTDFGYFEAHYKGLDTSQLEELPNWRESTAFTALEKRVIEYAEAMTATPLAVTDELTESIRRDIGDAAFVELTMMVAVENRRSRFNSALGLTSQGFKSQCELRR